MPVVHVSEPDYERLEGLAQADGSPGVRLLRRELERAVVLPEAELPAGCARLGSWVEYVDLLQGRVRTVQLVMPALADVDAGRLSVASPVGAALLGLRPEDTFGFTSEAGRPRVVVVHRVAEAP